MPAPSIFDIERVKDDPAPPEEFTLATDLTGHTATMVIAAVDGGDDVSITGTVTPGASSSSISFAVPAAATATAGPYEYAVILDIASATLRRTVIAGDWIVVDYAG